MWLGEGYDLVRAFSARDVKFYKPSQSKPYSQQCSSTVVRDACLPGESFMTPPSRAVAQPANDRKLGADGSHVMAGAWPQTHYHPSSRDTTQAHSPPGSDRGPCMVLLLSRDPCQPVFPGMCLLESIVPNPHTGDYWVFFLFQSRTSYQIAILCDYSPSANASPPNSFLCSALCPGAPLTPPPTPALLPDGF